MKRHEATPFKEGYWILHNKLGPQTNNNAAAKWRTFTSQTFLQHCIHKAISAPTTTCVKRKSRKMRWTHLTTSHSSKFTKYSVVELQFLAVHLSTNPINEQRGRLLAFPTIMTSNLHFCEIAFLRHLVLYAHTLIIHRDMPVNYY